jgi:hypothetical protein
LSAESRETTDSTPSLITTQSFGEKLSVSQDAVDIIHQILRLFPVPNIGIVLLGIIFAIDPILQ